MADKRVTDAIKKKEKEWADKQAKEKMTEDERRQAEEQERLQAQAKRDLDLTIKGLKLDVVDAVQELGLDAGFRNLIAVEDLATITDEDERKAKLTERVKGMKKLFDAEVAKEVAKAKAEFLKGSTPATGSSSNKKDETRLTEVEQRAKSNTNRLNEHDEILKSNSEMIGAIKELATEVKYMRGDLNETVERLNKLEGKDGDKWDKFKWLIVTGLVTLILGYLAVSVGLK